jgi:hypothetical protein
VPARKTGAFWPVLVSKAISIEPPVCCRAASWSSSRCAFDLSPLAAKAAAETAES